jgi:Wiskott-Aldrich syndrome protein
VSKKESIKNWFKRHSSKEEETTMAISAPSNFRHVSHIGWSPDSGFQVENIPPEWKKIFASAGIRKKELRDPEAAKFIMGVVISTASPDTATATAATTAAAAPPPPPPPAPTPTAAVSVPPPPAPREEEEVPRNRSFLDDIKAGSVTLKHIDPNDVPDLKTLNPTQEKTLVDTLASAMATRRVQMRIDESGQDSDDETWD